MNKLTTTLMMAASLLVPAAAHAEAQLGRDYAMLSPVQPTATKKIEVLEFFFYECGHCFHLHPLLAAWEKSKPADVEITYVPTMFRASTEPLAHAYYALESLGQIRQQDDAIYQAIHVENIGLYDLDSISAFLAKRGVDKARFSTAYDSFGVQGKVARAKQMLVSYHIEGTPTLIVDGKYVITGKLPEDTVRALKEVIALARKEHVAPASASDNKIVAAHKEPVMHQAKGDRVHIVVAGDTLGAIALRELGSVSKAFELRAEDGHAFDEQSAKRLRIGTRLLIPVAAAIKSSGK